MAACLYVVCRREKSALLLIDFSEALRVRTRSHVAWSPRWCCCGYADVGGAGAGACAWPCALSQTNVYVLGTCFLKFRRLLNLQLPVLDPSLYIHRFAAKVGGPRLWLACLACLRLTRADVLTHVRSVEPGRRRVQGRHDCAASGSEHEAGLDPDWPPVRAACTPLHALRWSLTLLSYLAGRRASAVLASSSRHASTALIARGKMC